MDKLMKPPFDKPVSFMKIFDETKQRRIIELVAEVKMLCGLAQLD